MTTTEARRSKKPDTLIINGPFEEPSRFWRYERETREFVLVEGERRPAGYVVATPGSQSFDDPGVFHELPLVNAIRPRIKAWREAEWPGVTGTTRRLLLHWHDKEARQFPFFFCQLEAIETIIWLSEASPAERQGIVVPGDGGPFPRWCTKMFTGGGKTLLMAMLIAWQALNKVANSKDSSYSKNILIIAPGLTVKSRLQVLQPAHPANYYAAFGVVPEALLEKLRLAKVLIQNWHRLDWDTDAQLAKKKTVDKRGAKSDEAYVRSVLGDMAGAQHLVVINDEGHHAWRVPPGARLAGADKAAAQDATKWVGGLDRIHKVRGILRCFDFSATPFAPSGKRSNEESLFEWIVSDFGLNDAIEAGLVKTPRVVVRDDSVPDAKQYRSRLYHIYADPDVKDDLNRKAEEHEPLPDLVLNAYYLLGKDWLETRKRWSEAGHRVPPVMITSANLTETAARIKYAFDHGKIRIEELCAPDRTLHIDSKVLDKAEQRDEPVVISEAQDDEEDGEEPRVVKLTKVQQAEMLRRRVATVGQAGEPGEQIQNVISVDMLSEGWDARTVTHILGLRAFTSQLLCEQFVGRGLRRTSYELNKETGLLDAEYVNVFGVPFTFLPHESEDGPPPPPPPPKTEVRALPEREAEFAISWPNILKIEPVLRHTLDVDLAKVTPLEIQASKVATLAQLAPSVSGKPDVSRISEIAIQDLARRMRFQKIAFESARDIYDQMQADWKGSKESLLAQLVRLVERFLASDRLRIDPPLFNQDELRRRVLLTLTMQQIVQHLWMAIREQNVLRREGTPVLEPVFDGERPVRSTSDMPTWFTGKPCEHTSRSHINVCVYDSTWEASDAFHLDRSEHVAAWAKNDHLGFEVWYVFRGVRKRFRPDFLVRLTNGRTLVLETKGQDSDENRTKRRFLAEWVRAVNGHGGFGEWAADVALSPDHIHGLLKRHAAQGSGSAPASEQSQSSTHSGSRPRADQ